MLLEICANSFQSALNAQKAGADRIELCQELSVGGITPSYGLIKQVKEKLHIPVFVLIRPRSGDFIYSDAEYKIMKSNIQLCKELGCDGIVSGILNTDRTIDIQRTQQLVELSKPLAFTFHRAFDEVVNAKKVLEQLIDLGVQRVLTSGQQDKAEGGIELLKELNEIAKDRITILAGSGISSENVDLFKAIGLKEIHASASIDLPLNLSKFGVKQTVSDRGEIERILKRIKSNPS